MYTEIYTLLIQASKIMKVHTKIQKWGNGLALRISGAMREIPHLKEGTEVDIEITKQGFTLIKSFSKGKNRLPFTEKDLLKEMSPEKAHADILAMPLSHETGSEW